jgi:hypothetical protein
MKYLKGYKNFSESVEMAPEPAVKPARPETKPDVKPRPTTRPTRRPSPIRRDRPGVEPDPMALKKDRIESVVKEFMDVANEEGFDYKKYFDKKK